VLPANCKQAKSAKASDAMSRFIGWSSDWIEWAGELSIAGHAKQPRRRGNSAHCLIGVSRGSCGAGRTSWRTSPRAQS
jgi:hypothetical protein